MRKKPQISYDIISIITEYGKLTCIDTNGIVLLPIKIKCVSSDHGDIQDKRNMTLENNEETTKKKT